MTLVTTMEGDLVTTMEGDIGTLGSCSLHGCSLHLSLGLEPVKPSNQPEQTHDGLVFFFLQINTIVFFYVSLRRLCKEKI